MRVTSVVRNPCWIGVVLIVLLASPAGIGAQESPGCVSELPKVVFVVERNTSMLDHWYGLPGQPTRWEATLDAISAAVNSAPLEMEFAVVGTSDSGDGWVGVSPLSSSDLHLISELTRTRRPNAQSRVIASAYAGVVEDYLRSGRRRARKPGWRQPVFAETCSRVEVIVIGDGIGDASDTDAPNHRFDDDVYLGRSAGRESAYTLLDDVAYRAANWDLARRVDGTQTVRTHTILLEATASSGGARAEKLFASAASVGGGLYTRADRPEDVALGISLAVTDALQSSGYVHNAFTLASNHRLFRAWTEVVGPYSAEGGAPLYRGHVEAFQLVDDPADPDYGVIGDVALWDAGELLAGRAAEAGGRNSYEFHGGLPHVFERTLWTNPAHAGSTLPRSMLAFDSSEIDAIGELLFNDYGSSYGGNDTDGCASPPGHDFDGDCDVEEDDAQIVVDFLRGVADAEFGTGGQSVSRPRSSWRMGGMFLGVPGFAEARPLIITDDRGFGAFLERISTLDSVLYVPSNDGFLHALKVPRLDDDGDGWEDSSTDPTGGWELWGYIPRHLLAYDSAFHADSHRAIQQLLDGELNLHDGSVNVTYAFMDGVPNLLGEDCQSATEDGRVDADGCEYHRVIVASMGLGSRYHYALDVSDPWAPRFLWEWVGDSDGWRKGLSTGEPVVAEVYEPDSDSFVQVVIWSGGTMDLDGPQNETAIKGKKWGWERGRGHGWGRERNRSAWAGPEIHEPAARWYMTNLVDPADGAFSSSGYRIDPRLSAYVDGSRDPRYGAADAASGLFGTPAAVDYDGDGTVDALYIGSRHGYVFKVLLDGADFSAAHIEDIDSESPQTCVLRAPAEFPDEEDTDAQNEAVYFRPSVARDHEGRIRISFGTGWPGNLLEHQDPGRMFFLTDGEQPGDEWECAEAAESSCGPGFDPLTLAPGEKLVGPVATLDSLILYATYVTDNVEDGAACGVGHARIYARNLADCSGGFVDGLDWGPEQLSVVDDLYVAIPGVPSRFSYSNGGTYLTVTGVDGNVESLGPIRPLPTAHLGDRQAYINWRGIY